MSPQSMSITQMLQPKETPFERRQEFNGKVKIFYTFKGSDTHCLCTFDFKLDNIKDRKWVNIPLKQCLKSVCSSCPDQLMNSQTAIYSANFEESITVENWSPLHDSKSNIIWEGHGALTNILNDEHNNPQVTGKVNVSDSTYYDYFIEVLIQLHPIRPSLPPATTTNSNESNHLPPMRSLFSDQKNDMPTHLPSLLKEEIYYPPALDPNWPGSRYDSSSFDHETIKRRKLTPSPKLMCPVPTRKVSVAPVSTSSSVVPTNNRILTDTYYHQSRRKKRDTKPPNANDIRPFVEVERRPDGTYVLPAEVDSWTVLSLGKVVWDKAAFHNQRYIYPVGYKVKKWYRSMVDPHSDTQYTCEILDGGDEPIFQLNADDNPSECWRGPTPTTVWTIAVRRAFAIRNMDYGHNPVGPDFFGLRKNTIAKMIQDLPNADKCKNYIWQNFEVMSNNKGKSVRRSNNNATRIPPTSSLDNHSISSSSTTTENN